MPIEPSRISLPERRGHAGARALSSALVPGLGQALQGRLATAAIQFGTVIAYVGAAFGLGGRRALLFAVLWNAWSAVDAYRHERD